MASIIAIAGILPCRDATTDISAASCSRVKDHCMLPSLPLQRLPIASCLLRKLFLNRKGASTRRVFQHAVSDAASLTPPTMEDSKPCVKDVLPTPIVIIDQETDPDATVVELSFGDRLGALLDTMQALKELGLNVVKSRISVEGPIGRKRFSITRGDGRKIEDPEMLEAIRLTIISNMLEYHPESSALLAMGNAFGVRAPSELDIDVATHIHISDDGPHQSLLYVETADRPGLLSEIVKVITDINASFVSGEFDTKVRNPEGVLSRLVFWRQMDLLCFLLNMDSLHLLAFDKQGLVAKAKFHVSYRGAALSKSMKQVTTFGMHSCESRLYESSTYKVVRA